MKIRYIQSEFSRYLKVILSEIKSYYMYILYFVIRHESLEEISINMASDINN